MSVATQRKLAAILSADVTGFSRLMGDDEVATHRTLLAHRRVMDARIAAHGGRIVGTAGDSVLADFPSVVEAIAAAVEIQGALEAENRHLPSDRQLVFRIGINLGDVIVDGNDIYGEGVNVAARLQALAEPGGILASAAVHDQVRGKVDLFFRDRGVHQVKNVAQPIRAYAVHGSAGAAKRGRRIPWIVAGAALVLLAVLLIGLTAADRLHLRGLVPDLAEQPGDRVTIAVLPLANQSGDPTQDYFSEGITEDLIAALGRFPEIAVLSRNAVVAYAQDGAAPQRLHDELGVRYVIEGSMRRADEQIRVTAQLTDAERGIVLWSERFEENLADVFALQDAITRRVAGSLAARLARVEQARSLAKPTENLAAYDLVLRGRALAAQLTRPANRQARALFERAIELDPDYARAYVELGWTYLNEPAHGWTEWPDTALEQAQAAARTAIRLDDSATEAYLVLASADHLQGRYESALAQVDRALELNPSLAEAYVERAGALARLGDSARALSAIETAFRYDPNGRADWHFVRALALYLDGQYAAAAEAADGCGRSFPEYDPCPVLRPAAYAQAGQTEQARASAEDLRRRLPFFDVDAFVVQFRQGTDRAHLAEGLHAAGL